MANDPIQAALDEDLGQGDLTSEFFVPASAGLWAKVTARQPCVLAGTAVAAEVFRRVDPTLQIAVVGADGLRLEPGQVALQVRGSARAILSAERTALNFLQRLSGIATLTAQFVRAVEGTGVRILDTRKTTPGLRALEKAAVVAGGGVNHRMSLGDMVLIKDNHWSSFGDPADLARKVAAFRAARPGVRVGVEADTLEQARMAFAISGVDRVLLDNMSPQVLRECVAARPRHVLLEASGGVCLGNARELALTGVDFLSAGALTHSAPAVDFGLDSNPLGP